MRHRRTLAVVATASGNVRPAEVLEVGHHAHGVVDAFEKHRFSRPGPFPRKDLVGRPIELQEPQIGARPEAPILVLRQRARWIGTMQRPLHVDERTLDRFDIRGAADPVIQFVQRCPRKAGVMALPFAF